MVMKIKSLVVRYQLEVIYIIVGGLTTLINLVVYILAIEAFHFHYMAANAAAWIVAVLFAYAANRKWTFKSKNKNVAFEIWLFVLSRVFSLVLEIVTLLVSVEIMRISDFTAKLFTAALVIICNYITGKWVVFKKRN